MNDIKIVLVEDDKSALDSLTELLKLDGFDVSPFFNPLESLNFIKQNDVEIVITDIKMPQMDGITLLKKIKQINSNIDIILMTAFGDISNAVNAIKQGASHYLLKPLNYDELKNQLNKIFELKKLKNIVSTSSNQEIEIVSKSKAMKNLLNFVEKIAPTDSTVLIEGETGTGKELISRLIHKKSNRFNNPFLPVNCAALPKELLESELFGYEKGSFTGATQSRKGKFILADKGTIFLDEISEMDYDIQAKLLRVLEDGIVEKIGSEKCFKTDIRIIAATNKNLEKMVQIGKFRKDLYFRLNVFKISLPPLKERKEDLHDLIMYFIKTYSKKYSKEIYTIDDKALNKLYNYDFPGNIRELKHIIERAVIICKTNEIKPDDILISNLEIISKEYCSNNGILIPYNITLKEAENKIILETLKKNNFDKRKTADILGISIRKIEMRFREMGISLKTLRNKF